MSSVSEAKRLINSDNGKGDLVAEGFHKLDDHIVEKRPPKIRWGEIYRRFNDREKIEYLEALASTMNHAAYLVQKERDDLGALCEKKEQQITSLNTALRQNNQLLQSEVTRMNEQRQGYHNEVAKLNKRIRELENGDLD